MPQPARQNRAAAANTSGATSANTATGAGAQQSAASRASQRTAAAGVAGTQGAAVTTGATGTTDVRQRILDANPNGVVVAIYAAYSARVHDAAEFQRAATEYARNQNAVGLNAAGELVMGTPIGVTAVGDVAERVQRIHLLLVGDIAESPLPQSTLVRSLGLFAHGESFGLGMDQNNAFTTRSTSDRARGEAANTDTATRTTSASVQALVTGLSGGTTANVRVQLFACSAARDSGQAEAYEDWVGHAEGGRRGQDSFASELSEALGPESSVYAHTTVGHTTENYATRVFGADAGGGQGGIQVFEILSSRAFIEGEVARPAIQQLLHGTNGPSPNPAADYTAVREAMWTHYRRAIGPGRTLGTPPRPLGQEIMANPTNAARLLHDDWTARAAEFVRRR